MGWLRDAVVTFVRLLFCGSAYYALPRFAWAESWRIAVIVADALCGIRRDA